MGSGLAGSRPDGGLGKDNNEERGRGMRLGGNYDDDDELTEGDDDHDGIT